MLCSSIFLFNNEKRDHLLLSLCHKCDERGSLMLQVEQMADKLKYMKPKCGFSPVLSRPGPQTQPQEAQDDKVDFFVIYLASPYPL